MNPKGGAVSTATTEFDAFYGGRATDNPDFNRVEWARLAAKRGRTERVKWQAMARMICRKPNLKLHITGTTPRTDGNDIWVRVPIEFGNPAPHDRKVCGQRDAKLQQMCHACSVLEDVTITILHECSHIANDSFAEMSDEDKLNLIRDAVRMEAKGLPDSKRAKKIERQFVAKPPRNYYAAAHGISPWLQMVLNALDDGRVNRAMVEARPGTKPMFESQTIRVFEQGITRNDGTVALWSEAVPNMQAVIGVYCKVSGIDYSTYLAPEVVEKLDDVDLDVLTHRASTARTITSLYRMSIQVLDRLRKLGFCLAPDEPEDDPEPPMGEDSDDSQKGDTDESDGSEQGDPQQGEGAGDGADAGEGDEEAESDQSSDGDGSDQDSQGGEQSAEGGSGTGDDTEPSQGGGSGGTPDNDTATGENDAEADPKSDDEGQAGTGGDSDDTDTDDDAEEADGSGAGGSDESEDDFDYTYDSTVEDDGEDAGTEGDDEFRDGESTERNQGHGMKEESLDMGDDADDETAGNSDQGDGESEDDWDGSNPKYKPSDDQPESQPYSEDDLQRDGTPEEVEEGFRQFGRHDEDGHVTNGADESWVGDQNNEEVERAIIQGEYFDAPSENVHGVSIRKDGEGRAWRSARYSGDMIKIDERILSPALMRLRLIFDDNKRWSHERNLNTGRIDSKTLYRLPGGDDRIFHRRTQPGKKDWFVCIGLDISGSTSGRAIEIIKQAAFAKAELCSRLGVKFAVYAHTGEYADGGMDLAIYEIKTPEQPWGKKQKELLSNLGPSSANLDGHTLEFYRKVCERQDTTEKLILYYTDGAMPMANYEEELEVLQHNIRLCRAMGIQLVGVGIKNDDPTEHGLDTVRLDEISDVPKVVQELEKRLRKQQ